MNRPADPMLSMSNAVAAQILLVEDNPLDVRLTREALKERNVLVSMSVADNGVDAMAFLRREDRHADAPRPDLILLDLNLPRMDGREVLMQIKQDPKLNQIPVVILTTSDADQDILKCYDQHANCYVVKPLELEQFFRVVAQIEGFWLTVVALPAG